jgi:hypothetical protein
MAVQRLRRRLRKSERAKKESSREQYAAQFSHLHSQAQTVPWKPINRSTDQPISRAQPFQSFLLQVRSSRILSCLDFNDGPIALCNGWRKCDLTGLAVTESSVSVTHS